MHNHSFLNIKNKILLVLFLILFIPLLVFIAVKFLYYINFKCIYLELFDIYCAGCGTTRMFKSIFELDFYQAFRYNPLMFILLIIALIYFIINVIRLFLNKPFIKINTKIIIIIGFILLIYMLLRNIPGFEYLRPTVI